MSETFWQKIFGGKKPRDVQTAEKGMKAQPQPNPNRTREEIRKAMVPTAQLRGDKRTPAQIRDAIRQPGPVARKRRGRR